MSTKFTLIVQDPVGLYATPATQLVHQAKKYQSEVTLRYGQKKVNLKSMMGVLSLGIPTNACLEIEAVGEDEKEAILDMKSCVVELGISTCESLSE